MATTSEDSMLASKRHIDTAQDLQMQGETEKAFMQLLFAVAYLHDAVRQARLEREDDGKWAT